VHFGHGLWSSAQWLQTEGVITHVSLPAPTAPLTPSVESRSRRSLRTSAVLLTGFEPFGGDSVNPSQEVAMRLHGKLIAGCKVESRVLPCEFDASGVALLAALREVRPQVVIALGQGGGRSAIVVERVAVNLDDAPTADNAGYRPVDQPVVRGAPTAHVSSLPVKAIVSALCERGIDASLSTSAGSFVCNHVFYGLMHALVRRPRVIGGFIHLPFLPEQSADRAERHSMPLSLMVEGVSTAIAIAVRELNGPQAPSATGE
jgi:pyroglutamyl-peptidase